MDQEAEIFKPRGGQNNFDTLDCMRQIKAAILEGRTTHEDELSESHNEHKSIKGMRASCTPNIK